MLLISVTTENVRRIIYLNRSHLTVDSLMTNMTFFSKATINCLLLLREGWRGLKNTGSSRKKPNLGPGVHVSTALLCLEGSIP